MSRLPPISHDKNHDYLVTGKKSFGIEPKGALKHKINVYQLFKEGFVKKKKFLVKCLVPASIKNIRYQVYVHLDQVLGDVLNGKCACKAGCGSCWKHVGAALYQLVKY